jgi:replication factor C subunit 3/5
MAEDAVAAMEVDEPQQAAKLTAAVKGKGKMGVVSQQQFTGGPWVEKYRPASLADVAAHRDIIDTIDRLTGENRLPHLLLYGPPGTGKTSTILAVARKLYGSYYQNMILELNASDDRGIDVVRQQVQDFASTQSISFGFVSSYIAVNSIRAFYMHFVFSVNHECFRNADVVDVVHCIIGSLPT